MRKYIAITNQSVWWGRFSDLDARELPGRLEEGICSFFYHRRHFGVQRLEKITERDCFEEINTIKRFQ